MKEAKTWATPEDASVKELLKCVKNVVFEADNVLDELNYHHLAEKIKASRHPGKTKVPTCVPLINQYPRRLRGVGWRIKELNKKFGDITTERRWYLECEYAPTPKRMFHVDEFFVGREVEEVKLVDILTNSTTKERTVAVVGMCGIGRLHWHVESSSTKISRPISGNHGFGWTF